MNGTRAYCPQCKNEVEFQRTGGLSRCPVCGFQYSLDQPGAGEAAPTSRRRKPLTPAQQVLVMAWMVLPAMFVLLSATPRQLNPLRSLLMNLPFVPMFRGAIDPVAAGMLLGVVNSFASAYWLAMRMSPNLAARIILGLFLGLGIIFLNVAVFFVGCLALAQASR